MRHRKTHVKGNAIINNKSNISLSVLISSWVSEEHTEDPSSELLELQEDLSLSEYSDPEADIPVVSLEQLKQERGGEMFPEEETREFLELLSERFGFTDLEVKLCYVEPEKQARKLCMFIFVS